ncbi:hypothetical protein [Chitinilyticum piscinae]|uniref:Lipoprotein n=1 Tax=Chitinilyticum piscinae TaxID=2866724 RepID=A0A8J7K2D2_9NEIS|nr:hypothetical protein [Chitinilyticum piscinae]MBE9609877.1 hypothetical protein [Chitinilyticum piscinae]
MLIRYVLALAAFGMLAGCSTMASFTVINRSSAPLTLIFSWRDGAQIPKQCQLRVITADKAVEDRPVRCEGRQMTLTLAPGERSLATIRMHNSGPLPELPLDSLQLQGEQGEQTLQGEALLGHFVQRAHAYELIYTGVKAEE